MARNRDIVKWSGTLEEGHLTHDMRSIVETGLSVTYGKASSCTHV